MLGEQAAIAGTPYTLVYQSDRVPGRRTGDSLEIPLTGANPPVERSPASTSTIEVAGRTITQVVRARARTSRRRSSSTASTPTGAPSRAARRSTSTIDYVYAAVYRTPGTFGSSFAADRRRDAVANRTRQEISVRQSWSGTIGGLNAPPSALAGWSVDVHHTYDPIGRTLLHRRRHQAQRRGPELRRHLDDTKSGLAFPEGIATAPDGALLVADSTAHVVRRIAPGGATTIVAGTGTAGFSGDGGAAAAAQARPPVRRGARARRRDLDRRRGQQPDPPDRRRTERSRRFAGTGEGGYAGDGGPATQARLDEPSDVAVDADGAVYVVDRANHAVRRIGTDGIISTLAGNGSPGFGGDGGVATARPPALAARRRGARVDGSVFVADGGNHRVRRIDPDGTIETVAGNGSDAYTRRRRPRDRRGPRHAVRGPAAARRRRADRRRRQRRAAQGRLRGHDRHRRRQRHARLPRRRRPGRPGADRLPAGDRARRRRHDLRRRRRQRPRPRARARPARACRSASSRSPPTTAARCTSSTAAAATCARSTRSRRPTCCASATTRAGA